MMETACPCSTLTVDVDESPALISPINLRRDGTAATSGARTANPSRVARGKGGKSRSARIGSASTRPVAERRSTDSVSRAKTLAACCATMRRASSKLTTPAECETGGMLNDDTQKSLKQESRPPFSQRTRFTEGDCVAIRARVRKWEDGLENSREAAQDYSPRRKPWAIGEPAQPRRGERIVATHTPEGRLPPTGDP